MADQARFPAEAAGWRLRCPHSRAGRGTGSQALRTWVCTTSTPIHMHVHGHHTGRAAQARADGSGSTDATRPSRSVSYIRLLRGREPPQAAQEQTWLARRGQGKLTFTEPIRGRGVARVEFQPWDVAGPCSPLQMRKRRREEAEQFGHVTQ